MSSTPRSGCPRRRLITALVTCGLLAFAAAPLMAATPDPWVTGKVKIAMLSQLPGGVGVNVDTFDGRVTLHGKVRSEADLVEAERLARLVPGVRAVRNLLQVVPRRAQAAVAVADQRAGNRVSKKLASDPALSRSRIAVKSVHAGVVLLGGHAHTLSDHLRALEVASRVPGVQHVASEIESPEAFADNELWYDDAPPRGSAARALHDAWVTSRIRLALMADPEISANDISVDTNNRRVTLFGIVPNLGVRDRVERVARNTADVLSVRNDLKVVPETEHNRIRADDRELKAAVLSRLANGGMASGLEVDVKAAVARLSGRVNSWAERYAVLTVARNTDGIRAIRDNLNVAMANANR